MPSDRASPRDQQLADRLHSAAIHLLRRLRRVDAASGLTAPRLSALSVLVFGGGRLTLGQLAAAEQVRPPTMSRLVQSLEADGLILRERDPADGRITYLRASPKGAAVLRAGRGRRVAALAARLGELTGAERDLLGRAATLLERVASEEDGAAGA